MTTYYVISDTTYYNVHTQTEMVTSSKENILIISSVSLIYAIAVPVGLLVMCLSLTALVLCVYLCNQQRKQYLLARKNANSHEQEPVYFTIDHQQVIGYGLNSSEARASSTIESTYDIISGYIYENVDTVKSEDISTPHSSGDDIVSLPYINIATTDRDNKGSEISEISDHDANYGQEDAYGFPTELANYVHKK